MPPGEIKAIIIHLTTSGKELENLSCKGKHLQFNLYKPTFSIRTHFLIWSYQACNYSYKLVTCMATKGAFTNYVCIFWHLTMYVPPLVCTFYVVNLANLLTTYRPLNANVICEGSLTEKRTYVDSGFVVNTLE